MCTFSLEQPSPICPFSHLGCHLQKTSQNIPFQLGLTPLDTGVPNCLLMSRNSLTDFAFEHRSGCCATKPGYAGDNGTIEIWLIDLLLCRLPVCWPWIRQLNDILLQLGRLCVSFVLIQSLWCIFHCLSLWISHSVDQSSHFVCWAALPARLSGYHCRHYIFYRALILLHCC